jgi:hypothetical protein
MKWPRIYALVIATQVIVVVLLALLGEAFS